MAVSTIQMIGKRPKAAPSLAASSAWPAGMPKAKTATPSATTSEARPACQAFHFSAPSSTNSVISGSAATSAESASDPATGLAIC